MRFPMQQQPLQELYPGRPYLPEYHYTRDNIPNENPEGLSLTKSTDKAFEQAAEIESEALSRHLGGQGKVLRHPPVMPEATIEDPTLAGVTILDTPNPNLSHEPNQFTLAKARKAVNELVRGVDTEADAVSGSNASIGPSVNLPLIQEKFQIGNQANRRQINKKNTKDVLDSFTDSNGPGIIFFVMIIVIALIIIGLIIYGVSVRAREE
uniref:Uncharacterized protein n=1 Tax=Marseillevirus LCMAC101 TaxID=2506602 RepID=A0A481YT63_9VIRU|nr:MAG: hypothetical protein LCMAC101_05600 [Marseillevirus LCMAC101]